MPRRLVLLVPAFPKASETFIASKFTGLHRRGWDVHVVCGRSEASEWKRFPAIARDKVLRRRVHVSWPHRPRWLAGLLAPISFLRCLMTSPRVTLRYMARGMRLFGLEAFRLAYLDADLIRLAPQILHFEFGTLAAHRMYVRRLLGCRVVVSFRGYDVNYVGLDQAGYFDGVWNLADGLHFLGEDLWRRARRRGCPSDRPHALIPPAIDTEFFDPGAGDPALRGDKLRILSVGRLEWKKGYDHALVAIRRLLDREVPCEYRILGDGEYLGAVAFARHQLGLEDTVSLLGAGSRDEVRSAMRWADVFLHAAVSEGFSNAVLEAQAMKLPVVCSDADGLAENVADGQTGFVVPSRSPDALAEKLAFLASNPEVCRRMGEEGRARVVQRFQLADQLTRFERFYEGVLGDGCEAAPGRGATSKQEPADEAIAAVNEPAAVGPEASVTMARDGLRGEASRSGDLGHEL